MEPRSLFIAENMKKVQFTLMEREITKTQLKQKP